MRAKVYCSRIRVAAQAMLKFLFSDEVTSGWPYPRLLRLRKWLLLSSFFAIAWAHFRLREDAIERLLGGVLVIDRTVLAGVLLLPLGLLTAQWLILLGQHYLSADVVLSDRISALRSDRMQQLTTQLADTDRMTSEALSVRNDIQRKMDQDEEVVRQGLRSIKAAKDLRGQELWRFARSLANRGTEPSDVGAQWRQALSELFVGEADLQAAETRFHELEENREQVHDEHRLAIARDPTSRRGFWMMEVWLDIVRLAPTTLLSFAAWAQVLLTVHRP